MGKRKRSRARLDVYYRDHVARLIRQAAGQRSAGMNGEQRTRSAMKPLNPVD